MISHLGAMIPVMVGKLLAKRMKGEKDFVGLTTLGEGGMQTGATHEGLNIAAVEQVPLVVVVTNNHWAYSTPNEREFACANLVDRAIGYGYEGHTIEGTDLNQCLEVIETAVKRARAGRPPQMVVAEVLRLAGHGEHAPDVDQVSGRKRPQSYRSRDLPVVRVSDRDRGGECCHGNVEGKNGSGSEIDVGRGTFRAAGSASAGEDSLRSTGGRRAA